MKVFISLPMNARLHADIKFDLKNIKEAFAKLHIDAIDAYIENDRSEIINCEHPGVYYMAESLKVMACCDAIYLADGWEKSDGCRIEKLVAESYGLKIINSEWLFPKPKGNVRTPYIQKLPSYGLNKDGITITCNDYYNRNDIQKFDAIDWGKESDKHVTKIAEQGSCDN